MCQQDPKYYGKALVKMVLIRASRKQHVLPVHNKGRKKISRQQWQKNIKNYNTVIAFHTFLFWNSSVRVIAIFIHYGTKVWKAPGPTSIAIFIPNSFQSLYLLKKITQLKTCNTYQLYGYYKIIKIYPNFQIFSRKC